ncbi:MAG TPA: carbamoyltransferase N-terminal domain-containing protein [Gaiellaceae bacterium]|nr:carbamoyltransferase N-terminal domain-containing protein [Gaiellaceae bacterium]
MARVLGVSCYFHDAAAVRVEDGALMLAAEEERFTRRKHDASFPQRAIEFCLEPGPVDYVAFYENPRAKFRRVLTTAATMGAPARDAFVHSMRAWLTERRGLRRRLARLAGVPRERVLTADHHLSHAASAYFPSEFDSAAVITVDGVGEWATATLGSASSTKGRHRLELASQVDFPHSLGLFYSALTDFLGFEVNEGEYKVMGMAPYGEPRFVEELSRVLRLYEDGSFWLDLDYFSFHYSARKAYTEKLSTLLGTGPRRRDEPFVPGDERSRRYADVAASVQQLTERAVVNLARAAHRRTGSRNLCFAGGVALNALANRRILEETEIERLFVPPAPGDSGAALGAALYVEHVVLGRRDRVALEHAYWGSRYSSGEIRSALEAADGVEYRELPDEEAVLSETVDALAAGQVVGWFQGRFEFGPRALGNRSILADPRAAEMKERINEKIKFREPFRPFAPAAAEDLAGKLVPPEQARQHPSRFMLLICDLDPSLASRLAAVDHFGTARLQTVRESWNPRFFHLLERWGEPSGMPVLLNTSFNLRGEPIVASPEDALRTFGRSGLDLLVLENFVVRKR